MKIYAKRVSGTNKWIEGIAETSVWEKGKLEFDDIAEWVLVLDALKKQLKKEFADIDKRIETYREDLKKDKIYYDAGMSLEGSLKDREKIKKMIKTLENKNEIEWNE